MRVQSAKEQIDSICLSEVVPYTQNEHYFFAYRTKLIGRYKTLLRKSRGEADIISLLEQHDSRSSRSSNVDQIISYLSGLGIGGIHAEDLAKLLPEDPMGPAVEIMAEVRAYFQG